MEVIDTEITDEISISEIMDVIWRHWIKIVILGMIMGVGAYIYNLCTYIPLYTADALLIINSKQIEIIGQDMFLVNDITTSKKLVDTYSVIMRSSQMASMVVEDLGLVISPELISENITVRNENGTEVIRITVKNKDPVLAADIANSLMKVAPSVIAETVEVGSIKVVDYAQIPTSPNQSKKMICVGIGFIIGIMLGVGVALLANYMDNTVKNDIDIRNKLRLTYLGGIPKIVKNKKSKSMTDNLIIANKCVNKSFNEAYKAVRTNVIFETKTSEAKTFIITSALDKKGKTTVAINMALSISQMQKSVLLIDCDFRNPSISKKLFQKYHGEMDIHSILNGKCKAEECIKNLSDTSVDVLCCNRIIENSSEVLGSLAMEYLLNDLRSKYDYIILDTPPAHLVTDTAVLSDYVEGIVFVIKQGYVDINLIYKCENSRMCS
ncbi:MAG: polysaccharide biosynthesis tyrosine autokinase [Eubacteriaceae bacterium]